MTHADISSRIDTLANAWENFKSINEQRLTELEKKDSADPLLKEQLQKLNDTIDLQQKQIHQMEAALARPGAETTYQQEDESHHKDLSNYLRKGIHPIEYGFTQKSLSTETDAEGGYVVPPQLSSRIIKTLHERNPFRQLAKVDTISTDALDFLEDRESAWSGWVHEKDPRGNDTAAPTLAKNRIITHELYAQPKATQKLIDDATIDIESWLVEKVSESFNDSEGAAFITGDNNGKPRGILDFPDGTDWYEIEQVGSGEAGAITADAVMSLYYDLKSAYSANGTYLMNRNTLHQLRALKDSSSDRYLWEPSMKLGTPDTLFGAPIAESSYMPDVQAGNLAIAFGDFKRAYQIVDRMGIRVLRDPFCDKPFVSFYTTKRVGGNVVDFNALKLMKIDA